MPTVSSQQFFGGKPVTPVTAPTSTPQAPGFLDRVSADITKRGDMVNQDIGGEGDPLQQGLRATADTFGIIPDVIGEAAKTVAPNLTQKVTDVLGQGYSKIVDAASPIGQKLLDLEQKNPGAAKNITDFLDMLSSGGSIAGDILSAEGAKGAVSLPADLTKTATKPIVDKLSGIEIPAFHGPEQGAKIMQRVARISPTKQVDFQRLSGGDTVGQYLVKRGIYGDVDSITGQLAKRFTESKATADRALAKLPGTYKPSPIKTALDDLFARESRVSTPGALSKDFTRVRELKLKYQKEGLTMPEINEVKRIYERNVRVDYVKQNLPEAVAKANSLDDAIRSWQAGKAKELGLQNLSDINKETQLAKNLLDELGNSYGRQQGNNAMTLTDWIMVSGGDPEAVAGLVTKKIVSSKAFQSGIAKRIAGQPTLDKPVPLFAEPRLSDYLQFLKSTADRTKPVQPRSLRK